MRRRNFAAGATLGALAACGGGAVSGPACSPSLLVDCCGDSTFSGFRQIAPGAAAVPLQDRPAARLSRLLGVGCIDHAISGATLQWHRDTFALASNPATALVMRFGAADSLAGTLPDVFTQALYAHVQAAQALGKTVVLVGLIWSVRKPEWQNPLGVGDEAYGRLAELSAKLDKIAKEVATARSCPFVDMRRLQFDGIIDIADAFHQSQAYSDRGVDAIAEELRHLPT